MTCLITDWPAGMRRQIHAVSMGLATEEHLQLEDTASHMLSWLIAEVTIAGVLRTREQHDPVS